MRKQVSFSELFERVLKRWWLIAIFAIIFAGLGAWYAKEKQTISYSADAQITIAHDYSKVVRKDDLFKIDVGMAPTYEKLDTNRDVVAGIQKSYNKKYKDKLGYTVKELGDKLDITATSGTVVYGVSVTADTPEKAVRLTNIATKVLKNKIPDLVPNSGNVKLMSKATDGTVLVHKSSSIKKYAAVGFIFGFLISAFGVIFRVFFKK